MVETSCSAVNGFARQNDAPAAEARRCISSVPSLVMNPNLRVTPSSVSCCSSSSPSITGIVTSAMTRSGARSRIIRSASEPSVASAMSPRARPAACNAFRTTNRTV
jgi:hypothetical protein